MPTIRAFRDEDTGGVAALWRRVFPDAPSWNVPEDDIRRKSKVQPELFFVAHQGADIVGTVMAGHDGHRGWVHLLAVSPEHRRHGVGRALMSTAEQALLAHGCTKLNLQVRAGNKPVVAFYRALGFEVEERVSMGKRLTGTA